MCLREIYCSKLLASSLILKVCISLETEQPQAVLGSLPQVSFNTSLRCGGELFISSFGKGIMLLPLPISVPAVLWMGTHTLRDEIRAGVKPEP